MKYEFHYTQEVHGTLIVEAANEQEAREKAEEYENEAQADGRDLTIDELLTPILS